MAETLNASKSNPPIGALLVAEYCKPTLQLASVWGKETSLTSITSVASIIRHLARASGHLYGQSILERTEVDHWISSSVAVKTNFENLEKALASSTYLVGQSITAADLAVWGSIYASQGDVSKFVNVSRWYKLIGNQPSIVDFLKTLPEDVKTVLKTSATPPRTGAGTGAGAGGKFVELPGAEEGKVVVRFPPEASGYLHIGHAKAAMLNQYYQQLFKGTLIMRFDDTNPAKENAEFEKVILEDLKLMHIHYDVFSHTSDHFDLLSQYCDKMLQEGNAYVDDTDPEIMKQEREQKVESQNRNNSVEKNMSLWQEMKNGTELGQKCCVRAKIDMQSCNGCMRDPTIYRCKPEPHVRTGYKYKVYPTYDFACPIVDSVEGVTHALRTTEYHDRDEQFYWFIDTLKLRKPFVWEYARLNMTNTVLSKRKLTWFVQNGFVDGWDDPRFPTVRGVLRHGMTVEGLKQFIISQGSSRTVVQMEWDKIWAINKKIIDPIAPRYTALEEGATARVHVRGVQPQRTVAACHPKNESVGTKDVWINDQILIEAADVDLLRVGENATFINWGNIKIVEIKKGQDGIVVEAEANVEDRDYKKTPKLTWLAVTDQAKFTPTVCVYFDHIISKAVLAKDEDFKKYINTNTRTEVFMVGDPELTKLKKGDIIQLQRRGFFICDSPYSPATAHSWKESPVILFHVPDGSAKEVMPSAVSKKDTKPNQVAAAPAQTTTQTSQNSDLESISQQIKTQGEKVRVLKSQKAAKAQIDSAVQELLSLKAAFKLASGQDWSVTAVVAKVESAPVVDSSAASADLNSLSNQIKASGDKVRDLKRTKAAKADIDAAVQELLSLKEAFKASSGMDWSPTTVAAKTAEMKSAPAVTSAASDLNSLNIQIKMSGDKVRDLKEKKADKALIDAAVKELLALKKSFKTLTGKEWTANAAPVKAAPPALASGANSDQLNAQIKAAGDKVRDLKNNKAAKSDIDAAVKELLDLKGEFKKATGVTWTQSALVPAKEESTLPVKKEATPPADNGLSAKIKECGDKVRDLKIKKAEKSEIDATVQELLRLKKEFKEATGYEWVPEGGAPARSSQPAKKAEKKEEKKKEPKKTEEKKEDDSASALKKQTRLGLEVKKDENLSEWYSQVITKAEMIEYYDVSGCYILRPWAYAIWESIKDFFDAEIKKLGVKNCYFPMFVSNQALEKEKTHIADFAPEVAWVTKSGNSDLAEPIAIRPTSETVMYPAYAKWIQSHRDLPMKLNQWNNVVRWEFKHPTPFLRTREFLWQEGHTAFATAKEAEAEVYDILELYSQVYTKLMAIPVIKGRKTEKEKFAGGDFTTTVEAFIAASGRGIQGATSHHLGQNFSKMFEIVVEDPETKEKMHIYQNSWGITTRTIGVMVMVHSDDKGLVLPPNVASVQVVIVPCGINVNVTEDEKKQLILACEEFEKSLRAAGIRVEGDYRDNYSPGWKFNHWELKGVPLRIEIGPRDVKTSQYVAVRRDTGEKITNPRGSAEKDISDLLTNIQKSLLDKATKELESHTVIVEDFKDFIPELDKKNIILAPFCGDVSCEENIKKESTRDDGPTDASGPAMGAKSLCIPFEQPAELKANQKCIYPSCCSKPKYYCLFGRSY